ncbi:ABC transporter substrate-binding protein [Spongiactinospora sp. 9N601]|uniref:ABC transporter substrate-binding protein n=1 Tax=Spongiactinospora sp. 9N601 TaxID=3375149 RepID=UPI0037B25D0B
MVSRDPIGRRTLLTYGGAGLLLAACGPQPAARPVVGATGPPRRGGSLVFATQGEAGGLDPATTLFDRSGHVYARAVFDRLAALDAQGRVRPYAARSITPNREATRWTIELRPGMTFHDGEPFDAAAVKANFDAQRGHDFLGLLLGPIEATRVTAKDTLVVEMKEPWAAFDSYLTGYPGAQLGYVASPKTLGKGGDPRHPVGSGPFVFKEWQAGDHLTLTRNERYWRRGLPYLDQVAFRPIPDPLARENAIRAGDIDALHSQDAQTIAAFRGEPGFTLADDLNTTFGQKDITLVALNVSRPPLDDLRVRQALACATDAAKYSKVIDKGLAPVMDGLFQRGSPYHARSPYPPHDVERAKRLIAEYERERGPLPPIKVTIQTTPRDITAFSLIQGMWRQAGIESAPVQVSKDNFGEVLLGGGYEAIIGAFFGAGDPDQNALYFSSASAAPNGEPALNFTRNRDKAIDAALAEGRRATGASARQAAYRALNERLNTALPFVWLDATPYSLVTRPDVGGLLDPALPDGGRELGLLRGVVNVTSAWRAA